MIRKSQSPNRLPDRKVTATSVADRRRLRQNVTALPGFVEVSSTLGHFCLSGLLWQNGLELIDMRSRLRRLVLLPAQILILLIQGLE